MADLSVKVQTGVLIYRRRYFGALTSEALYPATLRRCGHRHKTKVEAAACAAELLHEWKAGLVESEASDV